MLSHWFGLTPDDIDMLPWIRLNAYRQYLPSLPPPGGVVMVDPPK